MTEPIDIVEGERLAQEAMTKKLRGYPDPKSWQAFVDNHSPEHVVDLYGLVRELIGVVGRIDHTIVQDSLGRWDSSAIYDLQRDARALLKKLKL